jgi:hypothetical protein
MTDLILGCGRKKTAVASDRTPKIQNCCSSDLGQAESASDQVHLCCGRNFKDKVVANSNVLVLYRTHLCDLNQTSAHFSPKNTGSFPTGTQIASSAGTARATDPSPAATDQSSASYEKGPEMLNLFSFIPALHNRRASKRFPAVKLRRRHQRERASNDHESPWYVEPLERRQLLAGNVSAILTNAGTLRITGDSLSNQILIGSDGAGNTTVEGSSGTTVNGVASQTFFDIDFDEIPQDLVINMRGGNDLVEIDNVNIARNLRINMAAGNDTVGIYDTVVQQDAVIRLGGGSDFAASSRTDILDDLRIVGGGGSDAVGFSECFYVVDKTVVNTGGDQDLVFLQGEFGGTTAVSTGSGSDILTANQMDIDGDLTARTGGGGDEVLIGDDWLQTFGATITIIGGGDNDGLVRQPGAPSVEERGIEVSLTDAGVNSVIDTFGNALQVEYGNRGGDVTQLGCP